MLPLASVLVVLALILNFTWVPFNKNLFSISYVCLMGGTAIGVLWLFYMLVDVFHYIKYVFLPLEWMGKNGIDIASAIKMVFAFFPSLSASVILAFSFFFIFFS